MDSRVFWGVLCALLVFSGLVAVASAVRQRVVAQAVIEGAQQIGPPTSEPSLAELRRQASERYGEALKRLRLKGSERCIGGTVVQVSGSTYTQAIGPDGRPVACSGLYRLR